MKNYRIIILASSVALLAGCSSIHHTAQIVDRTTGVEASSINTDKPGYYTVRKGDTLNKIAREHKQKVPNLVAWNQLANQNDIKVYQVLRIQKPDAASTVGEVQVVSVAPQQNVEAKPLSASTVAPATLNKTAPLGEKQAYSDSALAAMQKPVSGATAAAAQTVPMKTAEGKPAEKITESSAAANEDKAITWIWPAEGKILASYEGKNKGIDIAGKAGQNVVAAADGRVTYAGAFRGFGNMVIVKHSENLLSVYSHNQSILVKQGDSVKRGQKIAEMGNSDSDAVKLHFEVRSQGKPVDPAQYLPKR